MPHADFIHLRAHSAYSLSEGAIRVDKLAALAKDAHMPAVAITDSGNLFGALEFSQYCSGKGIQPIIGCQIALTRADNARLNPDPIVLLAQNAEGLANLQRLSSQGFLDTDPSLKPQQTWDRIAAHAGGLILLTGGTTGPIGRLLQEGQMPEAERLLAMMLEAFPGRTMMELHRHGLEIDRAIEPGMIALADARGLPLVATNDVHFGKAKMYEAHDALLCIADGAFVSQDDRRRLTREHRFKTASEMQVQFSDLPEAIENTVEIARRCAFRPMKRKPILPVFVPESDKTAEEELKAQAVDGLARRLAASKLFAERKTYDERLDYELGIINRMGFPGYFLIVSDFMKWTRDQGIPVGVRGSGASSLVAWALYITNLDPLQFGLFFERFLNPERISMPDFDIDFCQERRDEVVR